MSNFWGAVQNGQPHPIVPSVTENDVLRNSAQTNGLPSNAGESVGQASTHSSMDGRPSLSDQIIIATVPPVQDKPSKGFKL